MFHIFGHDGNPVKFLYIPVDHWQFLFKFMTSLTISSLLPSQNCLRKVRDKFIRIIEYYVSNPVPIRPLRPVLPLPDDFNIHFWNTSIFFERRHPVRDASKDDYYENSLINFFFGEIMRYNFTGAALFKLKILIFFSLIPVKGELLGGK